MRRIFKKHHKCKDYYMPIVLPGSIIMLGGQQFEVWTANELALLAQQHIFGNFLYKMEVWDENSLAKFARERKADLNILQIYCRYCCSKMVSNLTNCDYCSTQYENK